MARKIFSFRLETDVVDRIDALGVDRSEYVRNAIEAALVGDPYVGPALAVVHPKPVKTVPVVKSDAVKPSAVVDKKPKPVRPKPASVRAGSKVVSPRAQDKVDLLALLRSKRLSSRQAKAELGWLGLRYENAERALMDEGSIWALDGVLEVL